MKRSKRRWRIFLSIVCVWFAVRTFWPLGPSLKSRSVRLGDNLARFTDSSHGYEYNWLSETQLLVSGQQVDVSTGKRMAPPFSKQLIGYSIDADTDAKLSPDGAWILFRCGTEARAGNNIAVTLDGSRRVVYEASEAFWEPDGKHWVATGPVDSARKLHVWIYGLDSPKPIRDFTAQLPAEAATGDWSPIGCTARNRLILRKCVDFNYDGDIECVDLGLDPNAAPPHYFRVPMPACAHLDEAEISPQGDRIAWDLYVWPSFRRLFARIQTSELWVSRLDGSAMHEIGYEIEGNLLTESGADSPVPIAMHWLPDGKRLSYVGEGEALYTVPAD